jgi:hypothetical protein
MLITKKPCELKVGDKLLGGLLITKITPIFNNYTLEFDYTVQFNNKDGSPHHTGFDYKHSANILMG